MPVWLTAISALSPVGAAALVAIAVRMIYGGRLVPRSTLEDMERIWTARLEESHQRERDWKTSAEVSAKAAEMASAQAEQMVRRLDVIERMIRALPRSRRTDGEAA